MGKYRQQSRVTYTRRNSRTGGSALVTRTVNDIRIDGSNPMEGSLNTKVVNLSSPTENNDVR